MLFECYYFHFISKNALLQLEGFYCSRCRDAVNAQLFALALNINYWFKSFSYIFFFSYQFETLHIRTSLKPWQSADITALLWCVYCGIQIPRIWYSPEVNACGSSHSRCDGRKRCSSLYRFLFICLCSPLTPSFPLLIADISLFTSKPPLPHLCPPIPAPSH